jgi:hypothetical protein
MPTARESAFAARMNDFQFEVVGHEEVTKTPIVEPAPEPTPIPEPEPAPKLAKPWEVVRPMPPNDGQTWQRGQKWRP